MNEGHLRVIEMRLGSGREGAGPDTLRSKTGTDEVLRPNQSVVFSGRWWQQQNPSFGGIYDVNLQHANTRRLVFACTPN